MIRLLGVLLRSATAVFRTRRQLVLENLALRQQLSVFRATSRRPALTDLDRAFWTLLRRRWSDWRRALVIVQPETVVRWHRQGFKYYWHWKSRRGHPGRPRRDTSDRTLIQQCSDAGLPCQRQLHTDQQILDSGDPIGADPTWDRHRDKPFWSGVARKLSRGRCKRLVQLANLHVRLGHVDGPI